MQEYYLKYDTDWLYTVDFKITRSDFIYKLILKVHFFVLLFICRYAFTLFESFNYFVN